MVSKCISSTKRRDYFIVIATSGIIKGCRYVENRLRRFIKFEVVDDESKPYIEAVIKLCSDGLSTGFVKVINGQIFHFELLPDSKLRNAVIDRLELMAIK